MSTYVVLLPGHEDTWEAASPEQRASVYARHEAFSTALAERGHTVVSGAELTHSRTARVVRADGQGGSVVTDGPYAETAEQLTGFYVVASEDLRDLLEVCALLADGESGVEVREAVGS